MAVQMSEYRERLLAQGCDEGLADAVLALVVEARDDAVAEALTRAEARSEHTEQVLGERLNGHVEKNEGQFESLMSTIHGSANQLRATFERRFTELSDRIGKVEGQLKELRGAVEGQIAGLRGTVDGQIAETRATVEGQLKELRGEIAELRGTVEGQIAELRGELKAQKADNEARHAEMKATIYRVAFLLGGLIVGMTSIIVGLAAAGVFG